MNLFARWMIFLFLVFIAMLLLLQFTGYLAPLVVYLLGGS